MLSLTLGIRRKTIRLLLWGEFGVMNSWHGSGVFAILCTTPGVPPSGVPPCCSKVPARAHFVTQRGTRTGCPPSVCRGSPVLSLLPTVPPLPIGREEAELAPQHPLQLQGIHRICSAWLGTNSTPAGPGHNYAKGESACSREKAVTVFSGFVCCCCHCCLLALFCTCIYIHTHTYTYIYTLVKSCCSFSHLFA